MGSINITDKQRIADGFKKYFVNVKRTLANKIPHQNIGPENYCRGSYIAFFFLNPVNENEIISIVNCFKNCAPERDNVRTSSTKVIPIY